MTAKTSFTEKHKNRPALRIVLWQLLNGKELLTGREIADFVQSARCTVVGQPDLSAFTPKSWAGILKLY